MATKYEGYGMLHYRIFADALLRQEPGAHVLGLAVWPPSTFDSQQYAEDSDLNLAAWRGAAGAESEAQRIFDLKAQDKERVQPVYGVLKNRWDELGNLDRFIAAPVAEAWKIAYAEEGRLTERRFFNAAGKLETTTRYAYDEQGRLEQEVEKDSRGRVNLTVTYTYPDDSPDARPANILRDRGSSSRILREFEYAPDGRPNLEEVYRLPSGGERVMLRSTRYE